MPNQPNSVVSDIRPKPLPLMEVWDRVDPIAADLHVDPEQGGLAALPYFKLSGPGFERLIYELLQVEGQRPWFFGRTGQSQYGIDIVTEIAGRQDIYQCKNYADVPTWPQVRNAVAKFESEWLNDKNLPAPREFVYCCPQPLNDNSFLVDWEKFKDAFRKRTGVVLSFWDRYAIDSRLRRLPDLVAALFSDSYAEHFCGRDEWRDDPWIRLQRGPARFLSINRFLERHEHSAIYVAEPYELLFLATLDRGSTVALRGLPGMGKSFLALELACRLRHPPRRIYYATFKDPASTERLWQSARRRLSVPALFVLDDCHLRKPEETEILLERLGPELQSGKLKLVLLLRDQVSASTERDDASPWLDRLKEENAIIDLRADVARTLAVACRLRPDFINLSQSRTERLHNICGGDLLLLDEILQTLSAPQDIDTLDIRKALANVRTHYFGGNADLPTVAKLAALAQFDLMPRTGFLQGHWRLGEEKLADPLMTRLFAPPRYHFLHSSLAELVLRALTQLDAGDDGLDDAVATTTVGVLREYLLYLSEHSSGKKAGSGELMDAIQQCLRVRLQLLAEPREILMKAALLADKAIQAAVRTDLRNQSFASLGVCVLMLAEAKHPAKTDYLDLIEHRFEILFERANGDCSDNGIITIGTGLKTLRRNDPDKWVAVLVRQGPEAFLRVILTHGTLLELFSVLRDTTSDFRKELLHRLTTAQVTTLIDKTITDRRSIGTIDFALRELQRTDGELLGRLEQTIGAPGFLRLILANGTVLEFLKLLRHATPDFRKELLDHLTTTEAKTLIDNTASVGRSICTIDFALRDLGEAGDELLVSLEKAIGTVGFLRLIVANGTVLELFSVIRHLTPEFRMALLNQLNPAQAASLVNKAVGQGRRIESLHFHLSAKTVSPEERSTLEALLGIDGWWILFIGTASLNSLSNITRAMNPEFSALVVAAATRVCVSDWQGIISRGWFRNACKFSAMELPRYPKCARRTFQEALTKSAASLARGATWFDLNSSLSTGESENAVLREALQTRMDAVQITDLFGLDLRESANAIVCCWRKRPDLHAEIVKNFRGILPPRASWLDDRGEIAVLRLVLELARSFEFPEKEASWLLEEVLLSLDQRVCQGIDTLPLLMFVWSIAALCYERGQDHRFAAPFHHTMQELLFDILENRLQPKGPNKEKLHQFAFAGLLAFVFPEHRARVTNMFVPLRSAARWLVDSASTQSFILAAFALEGISLQIGSKSVFTPAICIELLKKSEDHENIGPALKSLRVHVSQKLSQNVGGDQ